MTPKHYIEEPVTNPPKESGVYLCRRAYDKRFHEFEYVVDTWYLLYNGSQMKPVSWLRPMTEEEIAAQIPDDNRWCPDPCPITGRPFFMWLDHPDDGYVPTYGGPFDSYTIPERDINDGDRGYTVHRYDHDEGAWVDDESYSNADYDQGFKDGRVETVNNIFADQLKQDKEMEDFSMWTQLNKWHFVWAYGWTMDVTGAMISPQSTKFISFSDLLAEFRDWKDKEDPERDHTGQIIT